MPGSRVSLYFNQHEHRLSICLFLHLLLPICPSASDENYIHCLARQSCFLKKHFLSVCISSLAFIVSYSVSVSMSPSLILTHFLILHHHFPAPSPPPRSCSQLFSPILERRHILPFSPWLKPIAINSANDR